MVTITAEGLGKRYGAVDAVRDVSFEIRRGAVTGFLGANGAGKTTTLRLLLGLTRPSTGRASVDGVPYRALPEPCRRVGVALDADAFHPGRTGRDHLRRLASVAGLPAHRVDVVLDQVALSDVAGRRVGGWSLGMRRRLGLAAALLGDPEGLVLDEPMNGLDPDGIRWLRAFLRAGADAGRTVLVSSHLLAELAPVVDDILVLDRGRLLAHETVDRGGDLEARYVALTAEAREGEVRA